MPTKPSAVGERALINPLRKKVRVHNKHRFGVSHRHGFDEVGPDREVLVVVVQETPRTKRERRLMLARGRDERQERKEQLQSDRDYERQKQGSNRPRHQMRSGAYARQR